MHMKTSEKKIYVYGEDAPLLLECSRKLQETQPCGGISQNLFKWSCGIPRGDVLFRVYLLLLRSSKVTREG